MVDGYLTRIGYDGPRRADAETLRALHRAHLMAVPFENLDIVLGRPFGLEMAALEDKIVRRRRGGFCYELNGLFAVLLEALGFDVQRWSAGVFEGDRAGPAFDHLALSVTAAGPWLVDVGFGDSFVEPMRLDGSDHVEGERTYRVRPDGDGWILERSDAATATRPQYRFTRQPHTLAEFADMCRFHQTSPASGFTRRSVISRATPDGRVTLANGRLITTAGGTRDERAVTDVTELRQLLARHFGVELEADAPVERLLAAPPAAPG